MADDVNEEVGVGVDAVNEIRGAEFASRFAAAADCTCAIVAISIKKVTTVLYLIRLRNQYEVKPKNDTLRCFFPNFISISIIGNKPHLKKECWTFCITYKCKPSPSVLEVSLDSSSFDSGDTSIFTLECSCFIFSII